MILALGFWGMVLGYSLVYTGVSWFVTQGKSASLAQNLGLQTLTTAPQSTPGSSGPASSAPGTQV